MAKFKRDYRIEIGADTDDRCFWKVTHKGAFLKDAEDYETVLSMLDDIMEYAKSAIRIMNRLNK